jgi:hypothetical protein
MPLEAAGGRRAGGKLALLFSMTDKVLIPVLDDFDGHDAEIDLVPYFQDLIDSDLEPALEIDVGELDQRAAVHRG